MVEENDVFGELTQIGSLKNPNKQTNNPRCVFVRASSMA